MIHGSIKAGQQALIYNRVRKLGPYRMYAMQDITADWGGNAIVMVDLTPNTLGIGEAHINVNQWDVYSFDSRDITDFLLEHFIPERD